MESPPSFSTHSEAPPLSEDSGLLITSGSFSSDSASGWQPITSELQESDFDEQSLSLCESADTSERMCGDFFNTVKKGPGKVVLPAIEPPPEFQDSPVPVIIDSCTAVLVPPPIVVYSNESLCVSKSTSLDISDLPMTTRLSSPIYQKKLKAESVYERRQCLSHRFANTRLLHLSPCRAARPSSRSSLTSRLSTSHNSLVTQLPADDTGFITQAISHDALNSDAARALTHADIADLYNVPFDSDIYALPVDTLRPARSDAKKRTRERKKRNENAPQSNCAIGSRGLLEKTTKTREGRRKDNESKRRSLPAPSRSRSVIDSDTDTLRSTLREMRKYFHTLYSSSNDSDRKSAVDKRNGTITTKVASRAKKEEGSSAYTKRVDESHRGESINEDTEKGFLSSKLQNEVRDSRPAESTVSECSEKNDKNAGSSRRVKQSPVRMLSMNLKRGLCDLFRWRRPGGGRTGVVGGEDGDRAECSLAAGGVSPFAPRAPASRRALPPLPNTHADRNMRDHDTIDFPTSLRKVKDCGWYWGPISVEVAEKILSNEPDGSFIVRDSSDDHYIFTLTFKLNGLRHVRIEHDQGNFCFSGCTMFKAQTIVEFIEKAVETSRSGRYLFFLNLRPVLGPVRVQLLHPVSRFKRVQSLQHMTRFVVLKRVRRDLLGALPLPRRLIDYLSATHYYAEIPPDI